MTNSPIDTLRDGRLKSLSACLKGAGHETRLLNLNENLPPSARRSSSMRPTSNAEDDAPLCKPEAQRPFTTGTRRTPCKLSISKSIHPLLGTSP